MLRFEHRRSSGDATQKPGISHRRPMLPLVALILLFLAAMAIRVHNLDSPGLALDREYRSALIARAYYYEMTDSIPEWRQDVAAASKQRAGVLEPPIMELLVSLIYRAIDAEYLWIARLLGSAFWLIGGVFFFKVAGRLESVEAAVFSTAYYLFVPLGVLASRSFQPDPLMIMMFLVSLFSIVRYHDKPSMTRLVMAALISGLTILVRPLVLFTLFGAFTSLLVFQERAWKRAIDRHFVTFLSIFLLPCTLYYGYGLFIAGFLRSQSEGSIIPHLLLHQQYWKDWLLTATGAVGIIALVAGLVGLPMSRRGMPRALLIGLWGGYAVFCLVFTNHIRFATYYHLQLVVIVALSLGPIITLIMNRLRQLSNSWYWMLPVIGALLLLALFSVRDIRKGLASNRNLESVETAQEIGEIVAHGTRNVLLASHYGMPLEYYGELSGVYWPRSISDRDRALGLMRERTVEERLDALDFLPEYFVITQLEELNRYHADLKEYLVSNCSLVAESPMYLIYGACDEPI